LLTTGFMMLRSRPLRRGHRNRHGHAGGAPSPKLSGWPPRSGVASAVPAAGYSRASAVSATGCARRHGSLTVWIHAIPAGCYCCHAGRGGVGPERSTPSGPLPVGEGGLAGGKDDISWTFALRDSETRIAVAFTNAMRSASSAQRKRSEATQIRRSD